MCKIVTICIFLINETNHRSHKNLREIHNSIIFYLLIATLNIYLLMNLNKYFMYFIYKEKNNTASKQI